MPPSPSVLKRERGSLYFAGADIDFVGNLASEAAPNPRPCSLKDKNDDRRSKQREATSRDRRVVPPEFASKRAARDGTHRHMTLLTKNEIDQVVKKAVPGNESGAAFRAVLGKSDHLDSTKNSNNESKPVTNKKQLNKSHSREQIGERILQFCQSFLQDRLIREQDWFVVGIGQQVKPSARGRGRTNRLMSAPSGPARCFFLVCSYPRAAALRKKLGLPPKDFHISLGYNERDLHECSKGVDSLLSDQPHSLVATPSRIISSPRELVEVARSTMLGGKPNEKMLGTRICNNINNSQNGRFQHASILLDAAEGIMSIQKLHGEPINCQNASTLLSRFSDRHNELTPLLEILEMRCRIFGRKRDFRNVVRHADILIDILENTNSWEDTTTILKSIAHGYKGVAMSMKKEWSKALPCLRTSYELYRQAKRRNAASPSGKQCGGSTTRLETLREGEAVSIERVLAECCKTLGCDAPIPPLIALLLDVKSRFAKDGLAEGVVLRIEDRDVQWLVHRVKIVRPDFVGGITDHWTRHNMERQNVEKIPSKHKTGIDRNQNPRVLCPAIFRPALEEGDFARF